MKFELSIEDISGDWLWDEVTNNIPVVDATDPWHAFDQAIAKSRAANFMPRTIIIEKVDADE